MLAGTMRLVRIEYMKLIRRRVFYMGSVLYFAAVMIPLTLMYLHDRANQHASTYFPADWSGVLETAVVPASGFLVILVALLVASERAWRTTRQNVIDGLSRVEYYTGKFLLCAGLSLLVWAGTVAILMVFVQLEVWLPLAGHKSLPPAHLLDLIAVEMIGATLVRLLLVGMATFFIAMIASDTGPAVAFALIFTFVLPPFELMMTGFGPGARAMLQYAPYHIMTNLLAPFAYDAAALTTVNAAAAAQALGDHGITMDVVRWNSAGVAACVALAYAALFSLAASAVFARRDL